MGMQAGSKEMILKPDENKSDEEVTDVDFEEV